MICVRYDCNTILTVDCTEIQLFVPYYAQALFSQQADLFGRASKGSLYHDTGNNFKMKLKAIMPIYSAHWKKQRKQLRKQMEGEYFL